MKIWKILVLVGGLAGVAGFFLPIVNATGADGTTTGYSGFQVMKGISSGADLIDKAKAAGAGLEATKEQAAAIQSGAEVGIAALKGIIIGLYVPAFLMVVLGAVGLIRGRFQRLSGIFTLLLGLVSAAIWGVFALGASDANSGYSNGFGLHMLLIAGLVGLVSGIGAIVKPDGDKWTGV